MDNYFKLRGVDESNYPPYMPRYLLKYLPSRDQKVVDIGCGFGQTLLYLKNNGYNNILGIDINQYSLSRLDQNDIKSYNNNEDLYFDQYSQSQTSAANLIIMQHVLEHLEKDKIIHTLKNVRNMLTSDGALFVSVPNAQSHTGCYWAYEDFTHNCLFTAGSLLYVLRAAGFSKVHIVDPDCTAGCSIRRKIFIKFLLAIYKMNYTFWNKVTNSSFHRPSPQVFSYEIKAIAYK